MTVRSLMTSDPSCCTTETSLKDVAEMMVGCDCGAIPVIERQDLRKVVGVVTDRDIVCRTVANGQNPVTLTAAAVMTSPAVIVMDRDDVDEVIRVMETHRIRRVPVVDQNGDICGIVSLADIARHDSKKQAGELVREVSTPVRREVSTPAT
jgi:CBS domain-containing protein